MCNYHWGISVTEDLLFSLLVKNALNYTHTITMFQLLSHLKLPLFLPMLIIAT